MKVQKIIFTVTVLFCSFKAYGMDFSEYEHEETRIDGKAYTSYINPVECSLRVYFKDEKGLFLLGFNSKIQDLHTLKEVIKGVRSIKKEIVIERRDGTPFVEPISALISRHGEIGNGNEQNPYTVRVVEE